MLLIFSGYWPTRINPISGIFVVQQIAALSRAGFSVTVIVGKTVGKLSDHLLTPSELGLSDAVTLTEVPFVRMPEVISALPWALEFNIRSIGLSVSKKVASLVRERGLPYGCIIHGLRYCALTVPYWRAVLPGPTLAVVHGVDPFLLKQSVAARVGSQVSKAQVYLDWVALVGSPLRPHVAALGIDSSKTVVVPNGTDTPPLSALPLGAEGNGGFLKVVSVSNLIPLKGIEDNIRALSLLTREYGIGGWQYRIVGDGPERRRLEALTEALDLTDRIQFLGRLPYRETMEEIANADIFSLPSWGDAFGIVYLEAMARMRPTVGCMESGAADIITDGEDGILVPPKDPQSLALAFKRLFDQSELRTALGAKARRTAENYSWDVNASRILNLLARDRSSGGLRQRTLTKNSEVRTT